MNTINYWIWLQLGLGQGSTKVRLIYTKYGSPKTFYELGLKEWKVSGILSAAEIDKLKSVNLNVTEKIIGECKDLVYEIITPDNPKFPVRLINIPDYPAVLYCCGDIGNIDDEVAITIVGTRSQSPYGKKACYNIAFGLAKAGALIVSGGAYGVDSTAHKGALLAGGKTIAVLGCGINTRYLNENESMRKVISKNGAVISEYPPGAPATKHSFPIRNRIMSGLSLGTVVVEAAQRSGSLITASLAAEQGRDVFAVPGSIESEYSKGTNKLISDGAKPVICAIDILNEYNNHYPHKLNLILAEIFENKQSLKNFDLKFEQKFDISEINKYLEIKRILIAKKNEKKDNKDKNKKLKSEKNKIKDEKILEINSDLMNNISENAKSVYNYLTNEPIHIDKLAQECNLPVNKISAAITELELNQVIKSYAGRRFSR